MTTTDDTSPPRLAPLLEARDMVKTYGSVRALQQACFDVLPGEVVGLLGDNGAGKSTLVKVLSGVIAPDAGELLIDGRPVTLQTPEDARGHGIETVYQDLALAPDLNSIQNLFLGRELLRPGFAQWFGVLDRRAMRKSSEKAFQRIGTGIQDITAPISMLSGGQRQAVAVGRATIWAQRLLIMDEPTAALGVVQSARVGELIKTVASEGIAVVLVSHNLPFVFEVADRVQVMRLGSRVATYSTAEATMENVVGSMTGAIPPQRELEVAS
jgi:simple sugar transport system ATP-binding protein